MRWAICAVCMAFALPQARAYDGAHGSTGASPGRAWDFTLPTLDGKRFVQASALVGPVLVNFWGRDCPPCVAELPRLEAFAKANPHWTVLLVSTDAPVDASAFVQRHGITLPVLRPGANVIALMRGAGNRNGALPYSAALREGRLCAGHRGEVTDGDLQRIAAGCERPR